MNKWNENDVREIFNELDEITGADSKNIPIKINNRLKQLLQDIDFRIKIDDQKIFNSVKLL